VHNLMPFQEPQTTYAGRTVSHIQARPVLRRVGLTADDIDQILHELPDPFDVDSDGQTLQRLGLTLDRLVDLMGGSP
jgi:CBS-domain-containing membrane protein